MAHRIFLSHKHDDKVLVEPVALKLKDIFGEDAIFYDSWSIRPGDGIIERINEGLQAPEFVFFFVSELSLQSEMVKLEWQNALFKSTKGETRLIPVRVQNVVMPNVLLQTLYIDMYGVGLETAIAQIVGVIQGQSSYTPQHVGFSNLTYKLSNMPNGGLLVTISASHFLETHTRFGLLVENGDNELSAQVRGYDMIQAGFNQRPIPSLPYNVYAVYPIGCTITPERPLEVELTPQNGANVRFVDLIHGWSAPLKMIPQKQF